MKTGTSPFTILCHRIKRAMKQKGPLEGMTFYNEFSSVNERADNLPRVYVVDYSDNEGHGGGAGRGQLPTPPSNGMNSVLANSATVGLQLVVDKRSGWLTDDKVTLIKRMGILNIKDLLLDAIETNDNGEVDCSLDGTLSKPVMFATRESGIFDLGVIMDITVTLDGQRFHRASRSCLVEAEPAEPVDP